MPKPRRNPYHYQRPGRRGWYAFLDSDHKHISLETDDEATAIAKLAELVRGHRIRPAAPKTSEKTFAQVCLTCWQRAKVEHTHKTAYGLHRRLTAILHWLEGRGVYYARDVTVAVVEDYKAHVRKDNEAATVNRHLDNWRKAMKVAVELGLAPETALGMFKKMREPRPEPHRRGMTKTDLTKFLRATGDARYRALFRMVLGSGIRDDEARHLDDVNVRPGEIVVTPKEGWTTKGYRYRTIPISPTTYKAGREYLTAKSTMNLDSKKIWTIFDQACKTAGIAHYSMHDLRRAWASHMLAAGHKIASISRWLGHADIMTTMRYLRIVEDDMPDRKALPW